MSIQSGPKTDLVIVSPGAAVGEAAGELGDGCAGSRVSCALVSVGAWEGVM